MAPYECPAALQQEAAERAAAAPAPALSRNHSRCVSAHRARGLPGVHRMTFHAAAGLCSPACACKKPSGLQRLPKPACRAPGWRRAMCWRCRHMKATSMSGSSGPRRPPTTRAGCRCAWRAAPCRAWAAWRGSSLAAGATGAGEAGAGRPSGRVLQSIVVSRPGVKEVWLLCSSDCAGTGTKPGDAAERR